MFSGCRAGLMNKGKHLSEAASSSMGSSWRMALGGNEDQCLVPSCHSWAGKFGFMAST